jgi:hypothetical protein
MTKMGSLSVCCITRDPPERVAVVLEAFRAVADEIVVAADASSTVAAAPEIAAVADRICEIEYEPPLERYLGWLHSLCQGDWIFRIDGDELPSAALVKVLPTLVQARDVLQYRIPRRWLFGDAQWLDETPWSPDYQIRLVRNDPATLRFPGTVHSSAEPVLPARYLEEPLYHLLLLTTSRAERERRVAEYERLPRSEGQIVANEDFYVPELRTQPAVRRVSAEDRSIIERALAAEPARRVGPPSRDTIPRRAVDRTWALRELAPTAYDVLITPLVPLVKLEPRGELFIPIRIENRGPERFGWGDVEPRVRLGYRWLDGEDAGVEGPRTLLPADLLPGSSAVAPLRVLASTRPGRARIEVDLVHEGVRWFGAGASVTVEVDRPGITVEEHLGPTEGTPVVCITGMYRSGTSMVARIVNLLGVAFGPESLLVEAGVDNHSGFWESRPIVLVNQELLAAFGGTPLRPPTLPQGWEQSPAVDGLRVRARAAVRMLGHGDLVGWKDPATSLTLPFWRTVAPIRGTILCVREPRAVLRSLGRSGWPEAQLLDDSAGARLWLRYVVSAYRNDPSCLVLRYEDLFKQLDTCVDQIAEVLGLPEPDRGLRERIHRFVEPARRHDDGGEDENTTSAQMRLAYSVYRTIDDAARVRSLIEAVEAIWAQENEQRQRSEQELRALQRRLDDVTAAYDAAMSRLAVRGALKLARPFGPVLSYARSHLKRS